MYEIYRVGQVFQNKAAISSRKSFLNPKILRQKWVRLARQLEPAVHLPITATPAALPGQLRGPL